MNTFKAGKIVKIRSFYRHGEHKTVSVPFEVNVKEYISDGMYQGTVVSNCTGVYFHVSDVIRKVKRA